MLHPSLLYPYQGGCRQKLPSNLSGCFWRLLTFGCADSGLSQPPSAQTSPAKHRRTKAASPLTVPRHPHLPLSEFSSRGSHTLSVPPPQASYLPLTWTLHLSSALQHQPCIYTSPLFQIHSKRNNPQNTPFEPEQSSN